MGNNSYIAFYSGTEAKEIIIPVDVASFIEYRRHWFFRSTIIEFKFVYESLREFLEYMLDGGYKAVIKETKSGGVFSEKRTQYSLILTK